MNSRRSFIKRVSGLVAAGACAPFIPADRLEFGVPKKILIPETVLKIPSETLTLGNPMVFGAGDRVDSDINLRKTGESWINAARFKNWETVEDSWSTPVGVDQTPEDALARRLQSPTNPSTWPDDPLKIQVSGTSFISVPPSTRAEEYRLQVSDSPYGPWVDVDQAGTIFNKNTRLVRTMQVSERPLLSSVRIAPGKIS